MFNKIKSIYNYIHLRNQLIKEYNSENLLDRFSVLYGVPFRVDKAGRIYAVINPLLQNIKDNNASQIYEYTSEGMSDTTWIKQWVITKLMAVEKMFAAENLLDVLTFSIKQIEANGKPSGNYLVSFSPYGFEEYNSAKEFFIKLGIIAVVVLLLTFIGLQIFL